MIFVAVGTHTHGFDRLIRLIDDWAGVNDEPVVAQVGNSRFAPTHCQWFQFASASEIREWVSASRVVVTHGGAGMVLEALQLGRPLLIMPRLACFGEAIDDHQLELANALQSTGQARKVDDAATLARALASSASPRVTPSLRSDLVAAVADAVRG